MDLTQINKRKGNKIPRNEKIPWRDYGFKSLEEYKKARDVYWNHQPQLSPLEKTLPTDYKLTAFLRFKEMLFTNIWKHQDN